MRQLLTEGFVFGAMNVIPDNQLTESDRKVVSKYGGNHKNPILKGICQMADTKNGNGRVYPFEILKREIDKYIKIVNENRALGALDHPDESVVELDRVSHRILEMWWEGKNVMCKTMILDNPKLPCGQLAAGLIEEGITLGISSRGLGSIREDYRTGHTVVEDDFNLICFDLVSEPSTPGAWQHLQNKTKGDFSSKLNPMEEQELLKFLQKESKNSIESVLDQILRG